MTASHAAPAVAVPTLAAALQSLRDRGLRASSARRLVLGALFAADRPVSAGEIAAGMGGRLPPCDVATVYRNLETLEAAGLVRHCHLGHGPGLYELAGRPRRDYLVCDSCGAVRAADPRTLAGLRSLLRDRLGFEPRFDHFPLIGLCAECNPDEEE